MNGLKNAFYASRKFLILSAAAVLLLTYLLYNFAFAQNAEVNGLGILMVDTGPNSGTVNSYKKELQKLLDFENIGLYTLEESTAQDFAATVENYTVYKYIYSLIDGQNFDMLLVPEDMISGLQALGCLSPLNSELQEKLTEEEKSICIMDSMLYAFPLGNGFIAAPDGTVLSHSSFGTVYAVVTASGDHKAEAFTYLQWLAEHKGE